MKKSFHLAKSFAFLVFLFSLLVLTGCGPTEEEKETMRQEAGEEVDSMMNSLEAEMGNDSAASGTGTSQEEQTQTKESEEAPK